MSRKRPLPPPVEPFRDSVLNSLSRSNASKAASLDKRAQTAMSTSVEETIQGSATPPIKRRSSSLSGMARNAASQLPFGKPLMRRRSTLFDNLPTRSNAGSLLAVAESYQPPSYVQKLSQNSTLLGDDFSSNLPANDDQAFTATPTKKASRSSLFGAVMEKLGKPSSPEQGFKSPSGRSILNFMNKIASPFRFQSPHPKRRLSVSSPGSNPHTSTPPLKRMRTLDASPNQDSSSSLHDDDNWREAPIHQGQAEILDWSLKTRVELECHPSEALSTLVQSREWRETLLYWMYVPHSGGSTNSVSVRSVETTKTAAGESGGGKKGDLAGTKSIVQETLAVASQQATTNDNAIELASRLMRSVRQGMRSTTAARGATASDQTTDTGDALHPRRAWQQSFRSLYFQWCQQVQAEQNISTAMLDYYFYSMAHDHVVLFRVDNSGDTCLPRVLISSTGESFLQALRDATVESMMVLTEPTPSKHSSTSEDPLYKANHMSPTVKADLEALRKAQHFGEVAGADITIKIKGTKADTSRLEPTNLAVTLSGHDDVASFFEVYFNRCGQVHDDVDDDASCIRLPKLIAPKELGPFLHASMNTLETRPVLPKGSETDIGNAAIHGPLILPSVIRRVVALSASKLSTLRSTRNDDAGSSPFLSKSPSNEDALPAGSHYVVLHAVGEEKPTLGTIKSKKNVIKHSTISFNDIEANKVPTKSDEPASRASSQIPECRWGTTLQLIVWDVSRRNVAACKMGGLP